MKDEPAEQQPATSVNQMIEQINIALEQKGPEFSAVIEARWF